MWILAATFVFVEWLEVIPTPYGDVISVVLIYKCNHTFMKLHISVLYTTILCFDQTMGKTVLMQDFSLRVPVVSILGPPRHFPPFSPQWQWVSCRGGSCRAKWNKGQIVEPLPELNRWISFCETAWQFKLRFDVSSKANMTNSRKKKK